MPFIADEERLKYDDLIESLINKIARSANETIPEDNASRTMKTHSTYIMYKFLYDLFLKDDRILMMFDVNAVLKTINDNFAEYFNNIERRVQADRWLNRE